MKSLKDLLNDLNRTIYVGDRLESNLLALTFASAVCLVLGIVLIVIDFTLLFAAIATVVASAGCGYFSFVKKNREISIIFPTVFSAIMITYYVFTGANEGSAILWSILIPVGMCYFVSVRFGIILSSYYTILFFVVFYSPLKNTISQYYNKEFMERFPLLFASLTLFTVMAMVQYHRKTLFEMDYANRLAEEVAKQTAVAEERSKKIEQMSFETIQTLAHAIDAKDPYTRGHSSRVSDYSVEVAKALGWDEDRVSNLRFCAILHDIGKIGVPDSILNKPQRLTDVEYDIIKSHTTMGGDILKGRVNIGLAEDVARSHHERYDGKGYPRGLKGEEISEEARIVAIADSFDAMSSNRVYRKACDTEHIHKELIEGKGRQFDPEFVDVFVELWDNGKLDSIMMDDTAPDEEIAKMSSAMLQKAVEEFVSRFPMEAGAESENGDVDMKKLVHSLDDVGSYNGALSVGYGEFTKLYEFTSHLAERFSYPFMLIVVSLETSSGDEPREDELEKSMFYMEQSIRQAIRDVDIVTKYGKNHFLVILLGSEKDGAKIAVDRIFRGYYKMNGSGGLIPNYKLSGRE